MSGDEAAPKVTRGQAVEFVGKQLAQEYQGCQCEPEVPMHYGRCGPKRGRHHYGVQELRELLDLVFGPPSTDAEKLTGGMKDLA